MTLSGKRVLIFAAQYYEELELWYPKIRLEEEGCATVVAGVGEKIYYGKSGSYPVTVDAHATLPCAKWPPREGSSLAGPTAPV